MDAQTQTKPAAKLVQVLEFIVAHRGIVLGEWSNDPHGAKVCRAVFPTQIRKPCVSSGTSPFIKKVIDTFYPHVDYKATGNYAATIPMGEDRLFIAMESDLERRMGVLGWPMAYSDLGYGTLFKKSEEWVFLGIPKVLIYKGD